MRQPGDEVSDRNMLQGWNAICSRRQELFRRELQGRQIGRSIKIIDCEEAASVGASFFHFRTSSWEQMPHCGVIWSGAGQQRGETVVSRRYLTRQAGALIKFAKSTNNPELAAVLVERAAHLKAQVDETMPPIDPSPQAPDVEPSFN